MLTDAYHRHGICGYRCNIMEIVVVIGFIICIIDDIRVKILLYVVKATLGHLT